MQTTADRRDLGVNPADPLTAVVREQVLNLAWAQGCSVDGSPKDDRPGLFALRKCAVQRRDRRDKRSMNLLHQHANRWRSSNGHRARRPIDRHCRVPAGVATRSVAASERYPAGVYKRDDGLHEHPSMNCESGLEVAEAVCSLNDRFSGPNVRSWSTDGRISPRTRRRTRPPELRSLCASAEEAFPERVDSDRFSRLEPVLQDVEHLSPMREPGRGRPYRQG